MGHIPCLSWGGTPGHHAVSDTLDHMGHVHGHTGDLKAAMLFHAESLALKWGLKPKKVHASYSVIQFLEERGLLDT
jgi:hypothetical protein